MIQASEGHRASEKAVVTPGPLRGDLLHWVHTAPLPHPCCRGDGEAELDWARLSPEPGEPPSVPPGSRGEWTVAGQSTGSGFSLVPTGFLPPGLPRRDLGQGPFL